MEFLQELFNGKTLSFDELSKAVKDYNEKPENKDKQIKIGNVSGGEYVVRNKYETKVSELSAANKQITALNSQIADFKKDGDASKLKGELEALQEKYDKEILQMKKGSAIKDFLHERGVKHVDLLVKEFDFDGVEITEKGKFKGIENQFETLSEKYADLIPTERTDTDGSDYRYEPEAGGSSSHESGKTDFLKIFSENRLIKD